MLRDLKNMWPTILNGFWSSFIPVNQLNNQWIIQMNEKKGVLFQIQYQILYVPKYYNQMTLYFLQSVILQKSMHID